MDPALSKPNLLRFGIFEVDLKASELRKSSDHRLHLGQQDIPFKGVLGGYGLCWPVRDYLAVVDSPSQLVETHAIAAEVVISQARWSL